MSLSSGYGVFAFVATLCLLPIPARAVQSAASADDICSPAEDPCIIDKIFDVTGVLDFGIRKVLIVQGGRLRGQPDVYLSAGEIEIAVGVSEDASILADGSVGGSVDIGAQRACSGDATTPCFVDSQCQNNGSCSAGTGKIIADGMITATGSSPGYISIYGAGDVILKRRINASATVAGAEGGNIYIESVNGSVSTTGQILASSDVGAEEYSGGYGGWVDIAAGVDVTIGNMVRVWGLDTGGSVNIVADRDVIVNSDIISESGASAYSRGGYLRLTAGNDLTVDTAANGDLIQELSTDGGGIFDFNYGYWQSGYGGTQYLRAYYDVSLGPDSVIHSQGGPGASAGYIHIDAYRGDISAEGTILAQGLAPLGGGDSNAGGGAVYLQAYEGDVTLGKASVVDLSSPMGLGVVSIEGAGQVRLDGLIDVRGTASGSYVYSFPGLINVGYDYQGEVTIGGKLRGGGQDRLDQNWTIRACRLRLLKGAVLDQALEAPNAGAAGVYIEIGESMVADQGSKIQTDPTSWGRTSILYRDPAKPPVLNGEISPAPFLLAAPHLDGCPVCGNAEVDQGETCDDGNTVSSDGCTSDCQDEGCIAETPGYPATALCDDGIACSLDSCDNVAHSCHNVASCDDGVACTADACGESGCTHTIADVRCDDRNDCTFDICNPATGCVYADLTGIECEDGDFCTAPGTCEHGSCDVASGKHPSTAAVKTMIVAGGSNDRLKARFELPASQLDANPLLTGARLMLGDDRDREIWRAELPAASWTEASDSGGHSFRYVNPGSPSGGAADISTVTIVRDLELGTARAVVRMRRAELAGSMDQDSLSLSMLFGDPAPGDECVTARRLPCRQKEATVTCRD